MAPTPSIVIAPSFIHAKMIKHVSLHHFEDFYEKERLTLLKNTALLAPGAYFHRFPIVAQEHQKDIIGRMKNTSRKVNVCIWITNME